MKKLLLAATAVMALTGAASAADLAARPYAKAPMMAPVAPSWTGFYIFGGAGGGLWNADSNLNTVGGLAITRDQRLGGNGWFGTVGAGYDWQFNGSWLAGVFADGQFGDIRGSMTDPNFALEGREKLRTSYAAGVRVGYLVAPNVLSYVNGGYSGSDWSGAGLSTLAAGGGAVLANTPSFHRDGWFIGGGVENNLNIFGISAPGWFMKTEYRSAYYGRASLPETAVGATAPFQTVTFKPWVQTISTSLVYRFNWTGPIAKY
ncbi:outer membrane protein [Bradyrhizobium sp. SRS-191]|uniref:outer membrane protein n=1 Tax=Bradyrhizobium sp. SRS-191 TaxID=2962606 RepID=UPI00211E166E|nr:porin family protein [Bradyrhizobium sp. SRS-191]